MGHGKSVELQEFDIKARALQWARRHQHPAQQERNRVLRGKARRKARKEQQRGQSISGPEAD